MLFITGSHLQAYVKAGSHVRRQAQVRIRARVRARAPARAQAPAPGQIQAQEIVRVNRDDTIVREIDIVFSGQTKKLSCQPSWNLS